VSGHSSALAENSPQDCKVSRRFGPAASFRLKNKKDLPDHIIHPGTHRWGTQDKLVLSYKSVG
jgi:hypothetical protein